MAKQHNRVQVPSPSHCLKKSGVTDWANEVNSFPPLFVACMSALCFDWLRWLPLWLALCFDWLRWLPLWLAKAVSWFVERKSTGFEKYSRPKKKTGKELDITVPSRWSHFIKGFPVVFLSVSWSSSCWACLRSNTVNTPSCHSLNKITALPLKSVLLKLYPTTLYGTNPTINI